MFLPKLFPLGVVVLRFRAVFAEHITLRPYGQSLLKLFCSWDRKSLEHKLSLYVGYSYELWFSNIPNDAHASRTGRGAARRAYLSIYICLYVYLSIYLSIYMSIYLSIYLSIYIYIYIHIHLYVCIYIYMYYIHTCIYVYLPSRQVDLLRRPSGPLRLQSTWPDAEVR